MRTIGIIQPNYIPWRGFFDFIQEVDVFVFLDDVQYTPRDWRSRNRIKQADGETRWLTVPVSGGRDQLIRDVRIDNTQKWAKKHLEAFRHSYSKAPFFKRYFPALEEFYTPNRYEYLVDLNSDFTRRISGWLGLEPEFFTSSELHVDGVKDDRLLAIVKKLDGQTYLSGPAAEAYISPALWSNARINLLYKDYSGYPEYAQISDPFESAVTVLDLLFMVGPEAPDYIWGKYRTT